MGVYVSKVKEAEANLHLVGGGRERVASPGGLKTRDYPIRRLKRTNVRVKFVLNSRLNSG